MDRRIFMKYTGTLVASALLPSCLNKLKNGQNKSHLLIVSGWQDINIGDIAHTPGLIYILQTYLPNTIITLWKQSKDEKVEALLKKNFPQIEILYGAPNDDYVITDQKLLDVVYSADILIHGSGPSVVAEKCLKAWCKATDKPFGLYGVTIQDISSSLKILLNRASFIFTRETASIERLEKAGISKPEIRFVPDATFALNIHDENKAVSFLSEKGLEYKKFICVIPRLRKTPYWLIRKGGYTEKQIEEFTALNNKWKEIDHAKVRKVIIHWIRETKNKVLICPEMTYQIDIMDELLINPLPEDVKKYVVKRGYWLPDEAASIYSKAFCVLSFECHSPIIAIRNATPAFYLRQPEDTIKGQMYYDLGFDKWVFEINNTTGKQILDRLMGIYSDCVDAQSYIKKGVDKADELFVSGTKLISEYL